ncbi:hypothetical protein HDU84_005763 [Entophlyctis sp. JEL0112]|nr:hypothetical protein HDU84_005763 [Entophlyctis sp. JEL0112]
MSTALIQSNEDQVIGACTITGRSMSVVRSPYQEGELVLARLSILEPDSFSGTLILAPPNRPFTAISHLWLNSNVEDKLENENSISWTIDHDESATGPLNCCLSRLCKAAEPEEILIWIDFLCLPQAIVFPPAVFRSMSSVYGKIFNIIMHNNTLCEGSCERCVMVPICQLAGMPAWNGEYEELRQNVVEAERSSRCEDWLLSSSRDSPICDHKFAPDLKKIVDRTRMSYVSVDGWRGMGHVPYQHMRDCMLQLTIANEILKSEYFFRVWTFQEMILPPELYISFGVDRNGLSNVVDADAFISLTNMALMAFYNILKSASATDAPHNSAPFKAYIAAGKILMHSIEESLAIFNSGRTVGRTAKLELKQLSSRYVEDVITIFSLTPRKCKYACDFIFGLLGLVPVEVKNTRRVWVSGGFIKIRNGLANWWVSSVPKNIPDATFLKGTKPIADFDPSKRLGETFGNVRRGKNMRVLSNFSLVVGSPEISDGHKTFRLKSVICLQHRWENGISSKFEQRGMDSTELTKFIHAAVIRFGEGDKNLAEIVRAILGLEETASDTDSILRKDVIRYLGSIDPDETARTYFMGSTAPVNMLVTETEINELLGDSLYPPKYRVAIDFPCGCKFGCPDNILRRFMLLRYRKIANLLNLSAIQHREERLVVCEVEMDIKTDYFAKMLDDPDKADHKLSLEKYKKSEEDSSPYSEHFVRLLRSYKPFVPINGYLISLRDESTGPIVPHLDYIELIERGYRVYAARSSNYEHSQYQSLGLFAFEDDIDTQDFIEKSRVATETEGNAKSENGKTNDKEANNGAGPNKETQAKNKDQTAPSGKPEASGQNA